MKVNIFQFSAQRRGPTPTQLPFCSKTSTNFPPQIPRFRIVRSSDGEIHAEFLVVVSVGSHSIVTFGLWRRHSDFSKLASKVGITQSTYYSILLFVESFVGPSDFLFLVFVLYCLGLDDCGSLPPHRPNLGALVLSIGSEPEHEVRAIQRLQERHAIMAVSASQEEVVSLSG